jgi:hypothetical protein
MVSTPSLAAAREAESPPGPLPTTKTSVSAKTGITLDGSSICFMYSPLNCNYCNLNGTFSTKNQVVFIKKLSY